MTKMVATAALAIALGALAGCAGDSTDVGVDPTIRALVTVELRFPLIKDALSSNDAAAEECAGALDYAQITTGAPVVFRDSDGKTVGTADLQAPAPSDNLVICTWIAGTALEGNPRVVTAEVGGWTSAPASVKSRSVTFDLNTVEPGSEGIGSTATIDDTWSKE